METQIRKVKKGLYINPVTDFGFKYIFKDECIMMPFIEDVLGIKIKQLTYLNGEELGQTAEEKKVIYDLLCKDVNGNEFIVEMQNGDQLFFSDRIVYYLSKRISSQFKKGENQRWEYGLTPVYGIFILNFHMHGMKPSALRTIRLKVEQTGEVFNTNVTAYTLELPDYRNKSDKECKTSTETWLYNIANMENMTGDLSFKERQPAFIRLQEKARLGNLTPKEEIEYESSLKAHLDYNACVHFAQISGMEEGEAKGLKIGIAKGMAKGMAEGRAKGMAEGRAKGMAEGRAEVAKNLKSQGVDIFTISQATGLTPKQITEL